MMVNRAALIILTKLWTLRRRVLEQTHRLSSFLEILEQRVKLDLFLKKVRITMDWMMKKD